MMAGSLRGRAQAGAPAHIGAVAIIEALAVVNFAGDIQTLNNSKY
jgi:hypothetical protein